MYNKSQDYNQSQYTGNVHLTTRTVHLQALSGMILNAIQEY